MNAAFGALHGRAQDENPYRQILAARDDEQREYELDAEAVSGLINSPRIPEYIKGKLADAVVEYVPHPLTEPEVLRVALPLAIKAAQAEGGGDA